MRYRWEAALVAMAAIWGWTFVVVRDALAHTPPFLFLTLRFAMATATLAAIGGARGMRREDARAGTLIGIALFGGYAFQTVGLQYTTASNAGLITGLWVVFTPLLAAVVIRRLPSAAAGGGALLAFAGLVVLAAPRGLALARGDAIVLGCAVAFAAHFIAIGSLAQGRSPIRISLVQFVVVTVACGIWTVAGERAPLPTDASTWWALGITGVLASALALTIQVRAQQQIPPTRTAVILTAEPAFATLFGALLSGDRIGWRGLAGAALIVAGIVVAETLAPADERV